MKNGEEEENVDWDFEDYLNIMQKEPDTHYTSLNDFSDARMETIYRQKENEDCYSEDDYDCLQLFPDQNDPKFMELSVKIVSEQKRKQFLNQQLSQQNQQQHNIQNIKLWHNKNDPLLNEETTAAQAKKLNQMCKNPNNIKRIMDTEAFKKFQQGIYYPQGRIIKNAMSSMEIQFINWYVSLFGDEWKLIADVINYHPFTKGGLRDQDELKGYYTNYHETFYTQPYQKKLGINPWRCSGLPILVNNRPPSLLNSVHQQCIIH